MMVTALFDNVFYEVAELIIISAILQQDFTKSADFVIIGRRLYAELGRK